jgi:hypothetical protein
MDAPEKRPYTELLVLASLLSEHKEGFFLHATSSIIKSENKTLALQVGTPNTFVL